MRRFGVLACYLVTLQLIYAGWIAPVFSYAGFEYFTPALGEAAFALGVVGLTGLALPRAFRMPSDFFAHFLFVTLVIPILVVPTYIAGSPSPRVMIFGVICALSVIAIGFIGRLRTLRLPRLAITHRTYGAMLLGVSIVGLAVILVAVPLKLDLVWLTDVREHRSAFSESAQGAPGLFGYVLAWQSQALNPALIAYGLHRRSAILIVAGISGQVFVYSLVGQRQALLSLALVPAVYWLISGRRGRAVPSDGPDRFILLLVALSWTAALLDRLFNVIDFTSIFVRRFLVLPGVYSRQYVEYFSENGYANFGHSFLAPFVDARYNLAPPQEIASNLYGETFSANANFFADGFANLGYAGVALMVVVVASVAYLVNSVGRRHDAGLTAAMLAVPLSSLGNSAAPATLTTHGLGVVLVLLWLLPQEGAPSSAPIARRSRTRGTPAVR